MRVAVLLGAVLLLMGGCRGGAEKRGLPTPVVTETPSAAVLDDGLLQQLEAIRLEHAAIDASIAEVEEQFKRVEVRLSVLTTDAVQEMSQSVEEVDRMNKELDELLGEDK